MLPQGASCHLGPRIRVTLAPLTSQSVDWPKQGLGHFAVQDLLTQRRCGHLHDHSPRLWVAEPRLDGGPTQADTPKAGQGAKPRTAWWHEAVKEPLRSVGVLVAGGDARTRPRTRLSLGAAHRPARTAGRAHEDARGGSPELPRSVPHPMTPALKGGTLGLLNFTASRGPPCSYLT